MLLYFSATERWSDCEPRGNLYRGVVEAAAVAKKGEADGLVRVVGADRPIDIFYKPNELEPSDFEESWNRSLPLDGRPRLMDKIDLIVTKQLTDRLRDGLDVGFLTEKIEEEYRDRLLTLSCLRPHPKHQDLRRSGRAVESPARYNRSAVHRSRFEEILNTDAGTYGGGNWGVS